MAAYIARGLAIYNSCTSTYTPYRQRHPQAAAAYRDLIRQIDACQGYRERLRIQLRRGRDDSKYEAIISSPFRLAVAATA